MASSRAPWSIFWIGRDCLARVDLDLRRGERRHARVLPNGSDDLVASLEALLAGEPEPGERAYVVFEGAWTQTLDLNAPIVQGLDPAELAQALAFELEPASGLSALETLTSHVPVSGAPQGQHRYWASQISRRELDAARAALSARGSRLIAVTHPAGVVLPERGPRVEVWSQATWCGGGTSSPVVIGSQPGSRSWEQALRGWCDALGPLEVEIFSPLRANRQMARAIVPRSTEQEGALEAEAWNELLASAAPRLTEERRAPILRVDAGRASWIGPVLAGALLTLGASALCVFDGLRVASEAKVSEARAKELADRAEIVAALRKREAELNQELARREPALVDRERRLRRAVAARLEPAHRLHELLVQVRGQVSPQVALVRIEPTTAGGERIEGISTSQDEIGALATALAQGTAGLWSCGPAATSRIDERAAWHFQLELAVPDASPGPAR